jgi:hypothetical protein
MIVIENDQPGSESWLPRRATVCTERIVNESEAECACDRRKKGPWRHP